jgi:tetraacyldisaccharide 4'-kinase
MRRRHCRLAARRVRKGTSMKPQAWLAPLTPIYSAVVRAKNAAYDRGLLSTHHLQSPVISIGNLSTGGGGKTPLVIALAKLLSANGIAVDVLSRGYGRTSNQTERVILDTTDQASDRYGDEPLLIARAVDVPVFVGRSRFEAGVLAEQSKPPTNNLHLLDDGFQHRKLARDLDIVVLHRSDLAERLLPAGSLREPLSALHRTHVVVLREEDRDLDSRVSRYLQPGTQIWKIRRTLNCDVHGGPSVAFCGIARPEEFFSGLRRLGVELAATIAFPDHHRYEPADLRKLTEECRRARAANLITTEKDVVRLEPAALVTLSRSAPLTVASLETTLLDPEQALATVRQLLRAGRR